MGCIVAIHPCQCFHKERFYVRHLIKGCIVDYDRMVGHGRRSTLLGVYVGVNMYHNLCRMEPAHCTVYPCFCGYARLRVNLQHQSQDCVPPRCKTAGVNIALGYSWGASVSLSDSPAGCYVDDITVKFNAHADACTVGHGGRCTGDARVLCSRVSISGPSSGSERHNRAPASSLKYFQDR